MYKSINKNHTKKITKKKSGCPLPDGVIDTFFDTVEDCERACREFFSFVYVRHAMPVFHLLPIVDL